MEASRESQTGIENDINEWQDQIGQAAESNNELIGKLLRTKPVQKPKKLQDYDCE